MGTTPRGTRSLSCAKSRDLEKGKLMRIRMTAMEIERTLAEDQLGMVLVAALELRMPRVRSLLEGAGLGCAWRVHDFVEMEKCSAKVGKDGGDGR